MEVDGDVLLKTEFTGAGTLVSFLSVHEISFRLDFDDFIDQPDWLPCMPFISGSDVGAGACLASLTDTVGTRKRPSVC